VSVVQLVTQAAWPTVQKSSCRQPVVSGLTTHVIKPAFKRSSKLLTP